MMKKIRFKGIESFTAELVALEKAHGGRLPSGNLEKLAEEREELLKKSFVLSKGDFNAFYNAFAGKYWNKYKSLVIRSLRKEVHIRRRLASLYDYLELEAKKKEWEQYARLVEYARRKDPVQKRLMKKLYLMSKKTQEENIKIEQQFKEIQEIQQTLR